MKLKRKMKVFKAKFSDGIELKIGNPNNSLTTHSQLEHYSPTLREARAAATPVANTLRSSRSSPLILRT
jgi:hypothetical protein